MLLTVKDAAGRLGVSADLVYRLISGRKLRFVRIGYGRGRLRISDDAIEEYLARSTFAPQEPKALPPVRVKLKHLKI